MQLSAQSESDHRPPFVNCSRASIRAKLANSREEIHLERGTIPAEDGYAAAVRKQAFLSFYGALANACAQIVYDEYPESDYTKRNRPLSKCSMRVVASAPGSDSCTLAKAFAVALTRVNEERPYPLGCVFVVHHIATAEAVFLELSLLLPNAVAVLPKQHDAESAETQKHPSTFLVGELEQYPVIVVTHDFYMGSRGEQARNYTNGDLKLPRVVTFIDERSNEIAARVPGMVLLDATGLHRANQCVRRQRIHKARYCYC